MYIVRWWQFLRRSGTLKSFNMFYCNEPEPSEDSEDFRRYLACDCSMCNCNQPFPISMSSFSNKVKNSVLYSILKRKRSDITVYPNKVLRWYATRQLPQIYEVQEFHIGSTDRIFASQWLDELIVVYGTMRNKKSPWACWQFVQDVGPSKYAKDKLCTLNTITGKSSEISMIKRPTPIEPEKNFGIHSVEINPSKTMLATGGDNPNDLGIYKLPEFHPVCLGVKHTDTDRIYSVWLNNHLVATGSKDGCLCVWDTRCDAESETSTDSEVLIKEPVSWHTSIHSDESVRAIQYNTFSNELASLYTNRDCRLHIWDVNRFETVFSIDLPYQYYNSLSLEPSHCLYAVGAITYVHLLDGRCPSKFCYTVEPFDRHGGIRSLSFHNDVVTMGGSTSYGGSLTFFDLRTYKYIEKPGGNVCEFKTGRHGNGWSTVVDTHCYDPTGSKIFIGGGSIGLNGAYAALLQ